VYGVVKPLEYFGVHLVDDDLSILSGVQAEATFAVEESCCPRQFFSVHVIDSTISCGRR
jgi:hypothetical protein